MLAKCHEAGSGLSRAREKQFADGQRKFKIIFETILKCSRLQKAGSIMAYLCDPLTAVMSVKLSAVATIQTVESVGSRSLATASGITPHNGRVAIHAQRESRVLLRVLRIAFMRRAVSAKRRAATLPQWPASSAAYDSHAVQRYRLQLRAPLFPGKSGE